MKKFLQNKNVIIGAAVLALILIVLLLSVLLGGNRLPDGKDETLFASPTAEVTQTGIPAEPTAAPADDPAEAPTATAVPARGYVMVQTATQYGFLPLPEEEYSIPVSQILPDGTTCTNVIHLLPDGVYMESSTCENQDCVGEGTVTLENKADRVLGNFILCLPNQVTLQLFTPEELLEIYSAAEPAAEESNAQD